MRRKNWDLLSLFLMMSGAFLTMWALSPGRFLRLDNFQSMAFQLPELGLLALAMMVTMLTGGINLSVIASANMSGIVTAMVIKGFINTETPVPGSEWIVLLALAAGLATAAAIGLANGIIIAVVEMPPILATLGMMTLVNGLTVVLTKGYVISGFPAAVRYIGNGLLFGIPFPLILFAAAAICMSVVLNRTALGFNIYMIGSNATASFFSGVNNRTVLIKTYVLSGLLTGLAAIVMISRFNSAKAGYGASYLLVTVLASVLGGTSTVGGFGKVSGIVLALVTLQIVSSGLNFLSVNTFLTNAIWGIILIFVMAMNFIRQVMREKRVTR